MKTWTFLFTDIEGSTALFERAPQSYRLALAQHFELLRAAIAAHDGRAFRSTGDGLLAVFDDSAQALRCGVACQQALAAAEWPEEIGALRVRIGIHRGPAEPAEGDFEGLTMHHATRVLDAAHGGQVICSTIVRDDAGALGQAVQLGDLGLYRLRGAPEPVRLYQVQAVGASAPAFPPLRTAPAFTHSLPAVPTRFFGREAELQELARLLIPEPPSSQPRRCGRLVTLLGPGGNGKTRLSLAVAERLLTSYSHAVWFVPLAEIRDAGLLPDALRCALEIEPEADVPPLEQVVRHLRGQPSLVVLDNFEQLVPDGVATVRTLLERVPQLVCLVSSRIRLELQAEQDFGLAPLRLPPLTGTPEELLRYASVELFCDRARAVRRDFLYGEANAADIARICRALEGIPLAIELAAARMTVLAPPQILARLGQRLDFLVGRQQDYADRHRTLRATVAWSYELLSPGLQKSFAHFSIFRGGWTLAAAEAVLGADAVLVLEHIAELERCSLLIAKETRGEMRYRMLEVIREFACERLSGADLDASRARFHRFFHTLACEPWDADEAARLAALDAERDNLRQLLEAGGAAEERADAAMALLPFWMTRGSFREGKNWVQQTAAGLVDPVKQARAINVEALLAWRCGATDEARTLFTGALRAWECFGHERNAAAVLNNLAIIAKQGGEFPAAVDFLERSLVVFRRLELRSEEAAVLNNLGEIALLTGDYPRAEELLHESLRRQRAQGEKISMANTLHNLAELALRQRAYAAARAALGECIALHIELDTPAHEAGCFLTLISLALDDGRPRLAAGCLGALRMAMQNGPTPHSHPLETELALRHDRLLALLGAEEMRDLLASGRSLDFSRVLDVAGNWDLELDVFDAAESPSAA